MASQVEIANRKNKECKMCFVVKPLEDFYTKKASADKHDSYCKECCREKARNYRKMFPDVVKKTSEKTRIKNREKIRERERKIYSKVKNDPEYISRRKRNYDKNKHKYQASDRNKRIEFNKRWKHPCEKCGEERLYLIQFHHIDPKTKEFCIGASCIAKDEKTLVKEVKKCVCLCSNCHDEFHYFYGSRPKDPVGALNEYLKEKENK